jgi:hypothetical protein
MQQGRVTLEADFNEELAIAGEELREETRDIVGPSGTPDDGYLVTPLSNPIFDISVGPGTMYVGGLRVTTPPPVPLAALAEGTPNLDGGVVETSKKFSIGIRYTQQTDWLDHSDDQDWVEISPNNPPTNEFVYLFLREQEVSAVEDSDLKDVALGGPDTAQRTRLLQHIVRLNDGQDCPSGLAAAEKKWKTEGLAFHPRNMRLESAARLKVGFSPSGPPPDLCNPQAQSGYLGADNQLIRVQISATGAGKLKFVWGFDDASFLYRIDLDPNNKQLLHLQSRPVDAAHQPRNKQAVEALRSAAELSNREYIASLSGVVFTLDQDYNPDTQMISLPAPLTKLPDEYYDSSLTPRVFLRVWQEELDFTPGTPVDLGNTGLQVTLQAAGNVFHLGDYWLFAVRPSTPQQVYPERYLQGFQPPDGPRMWACPLGVITWTEREGRLADDCRNQFDNLVELTKRKGLGGCCTISVSPKDLKGKTTLQSVVDSLISPAMVLTAADAGTAGNDIEFAVIKVFPDPNPLQTRFTVGLSDRHSYKGLTTATIQSVLAASPGLVQISGAVTPGLAPQAGRRKLSGGTATAKATAEFANVQAGIAFTLAAKKVGSVGNQTYVAVTNVDLSAGTFDLDVLYEVEVPSISLEQLGQNIDESLAYDIVISAPTGRNLLVPSTGGILLKDGADGQQPVKASATLYADLQSKICFAPGNYGLAGTLVLDRRHTGLTLEGCSGEVVLEAATGGESNFLQGLVAVVGAAHITLSGLSFALPAVGFIKAGGLMADIPLKTLAAIGVPDIAFMETAVGVRTVGCANLTIKDCVFEFQSINETGFIFFEAGILASGENRGLVLKDNTFRHTGAVAPGDVRFGYVLSPSLSQVEIISAATGGSVLATGTGIDQRGRFFENALALPAALTEATISGNDFSGRSGAVVVYASIGGVSIDSNRVEACRAGFMLFTLRAAFSNETRFFEVVFDTSFIFGATLATGYPLPEKADRTGQIQIATEGSLSSSGTGLFEQLLRLTELFVAADMAAFSRTALFAPSTVMVSRNEVETAGADAGPAFIMWGDDSDARAAIVMNGNTMRGRPVAQSVFQNQSLVPLAAIFDVAWGSVTGNVILNETEGDGKISLAIGPLRAAFKGHLTEIPPTGFETKFFATGPQGITSAGLPVNEVLGVIGATAAAIGGVGATGATGATGPPPPIDTHIAVTGNTLRGFPLLPPHGLPAPFARWEPLNLIINL